MKPRLKYDANKSEDNVVAYHVQPSLLGGYTGNYKVDKANFEHDSEVAIAYTPAAEKMMRTVKKLFEIEGIEQITVRDHIVSVKKIVLAEWLADGIHEAICRVLKTNLYSREDVEVLPMPGCDFPKE